MTLDEAIKHCELVVKNAEMLCSISVGTKAKRDSQKCAEEHRQLADWLKEYKQILESGDCNECAKSGCCDYEPQWGELVRYNCPHFVRGEQE